MYSVPQKYFFRLHQVRPRFKNQIEDVLFYVSQAIANLPKDNKENFRKKLNVAIRQFPGNSRSTQKTIDNWRTEISSLFGFIVYDGNYRMPGRRAQELAVNMDLAEFFKCFLYTFQYPGAHITKESIVKQIEHGVHFKPAKYILKVMKYASKKEGKEIFLTTAEVCHCIFNDLRCTRDNESEYRVWKRIKDNRQNKVEYDTTGDVVRYAGDILDYMVHANLLKCYDGKHYGIQQLENENVEKFVSSNNWFAGYDSLIKERTASYDQIDAAYEEWFRYVKQDMGSMSFATNVATFISDTTEQLNHLNEQLIENHKLLTGAEEVSTKDIGDLGENLVFGHECRRIKLEGREDLIHLIKLIPTSFAIGYDISSIEKDERKRCIEVKTTISRKRLQINQVHLTRNEWNTARSFLDRYFIYRLLISKEKNELLVIQNPVKLYESKRIFVTFDEGAANVSFTSTTIGKREELLQWGD